MAYTRDEAWLLRDKYGGVPSAAFEADRESLARGVPLAYLIGWVPFLGARIHLSSRPLIPRVETEQWVEQALMENPKAQRVLDAFCGSGCCGIAALRALPGSHATFADIRSDHLETVRENIAENSIDPARAAYAASDCLLEVTGVFDLVLANPPYIPESRMLAESVARHEPADALYGGPDGLALIRRFLEMLPTHLSAAGVAYIEVDESHAQKALALAEKAGFSGTVRIDQYERPRTLVLRYAR